ncbi:DarT ssDNA thymidine ADP-ribosyltransferase family protein [Tritonibacter mobilis]|uniref:DarT ssDNA thymidine ADP-ribosyltransferase family protein n=1 Tax=Tritonibacter mobilis TaxID=379347 RepID=UPI000806EFF2|nr:DarT ssDNA thymidine ADP-ribosyltransferase family protein [Tritonibacter mobilis]
MSIQDIVTARSISEVVHFTTNHGCLGTLYTQKLLSRAKLHDDEMVQYLFAANAELRRDKAYLDHISLSVEHINTKFFNVSAGKWHRDEPIFWCILAFDPIVLSHEGVVFATTNNIYTSVKRGEGEDGFENLYSKQVSQWAGNVVTRSVTLQPCYPTCFQAEALYPAELSTEYLHRIYVKTETDQSEVVGFLKATFHRDVDVIVCPEKFEERAE